MMSLIAYPLDTWEHPVLHCMYPIPLVLSSLTYDMDGTVHWTPMCIQYPHILHVHLISLYCVE